MSGPTRWCQNCGAGLEPEPKARYCSNACRQAAYRKRRKAAPAGPPPAPAPAGPQPPRAASTSPPGGRLPVPLDSFVGRGGELDALGGLLADCRLLTLTGPPGIGKTRLAVEFVAGVRDRYPDGFWFVDLTTVSDPDLLPQTVAAAFGARERHGEPLLAACGEALAGRRALVLLDNCEHLVDACARLAIELLGRCPELTLLCTSREVLRVPGEVAYVLDGLPTEPEAASGRAQPGDRDDPDAVRLFVQRAAASGRGLALTPETRQEVSKLCACLDGSPLAIELAARWVRILPVGEILSRLSDRFNLLVAGPRTAPDRQRSLHRALDWSHATLDAEERVVFRRLAVLAGSFGLEGATAVTAGDRVPVETVLHALDGLAAKSLLASADSGRFRYLESIRMFAREQLDVAGELDDAYDRLLDWLCGLAAPLVTDLVVTASVHKPLDRERDNLQHAVEWAISRGDDRQVLLAVALCLCWRRMGHVAQGVKLIERVLSRGGVPLAHRALALTTAAEMMMFQEEPGRGIELAEPAVAIARELGDPVTLARALRPLGGIRHALGDLRVALDCYDERLALARSLGLPVYTAMCLNDVAWTALEDGDHGRTAEALREALAVLRERDEPRLFHAVLHTDAVLALEQRELERAEHALIEILRHPDVHRLDAMFGVEGLVIVAARRGHAERALRMLGAADRTRAELQYPREDWWGRRIDEAESAARRLLPHDTAEAELESGRRTDLDPVVDWALDWQDHNQDPATDRAAQAAPQLTARELQIATLVAESLTNRQIGRRLGISERTVETHVKNIRERLSLASRLAIAVWVTTQGQQGQQGQRGRRGRGRPEPPAPAVNP